MTKAFDTSVAATIELGEVQRRMKMNALRYDWMDNDNPNNIGGRYTDITQIAHRLETLVKLAFPVNSVPADIEKDLRELVTLLGAGESAIDSLVERISDVISGDNNNWVRP